MDVVLNLLIVNLLQGFLYAVLALGVYITYSILDFPDLSVDGTVPLGAVVSALLILRGVNPWISLLAAFAAGAAAGCVTGLLHVKLHIRPLLCGIIVMTGLLSVNLVIMKAGTGGQSIASLFQERTVVNSAPITLLPDNLGGFLKLRTLLLMAVIAVACKALLDWYFSTRSGLMLRAAGDNSGFVTQLARDPGRYKVLGLMLGNGFAALAGALIVQEKGAADLQFGTGMVVHGLAAVIIGVSLLRRARFLRETTKVIVGSVIYSLCLSIADAMNLSDYMKLIMAALFVIALVASDRLDREGGRRAKRVKSGKETVPKGGDAE